MDPQSRPASSDVVADLEARLAAEPWAFDFFQAIRRLEHAFPDLPRVGTARSIDEEIVRFGQKVTLAFEPASIAEFEEADEDHPARMLVYFLGLFGPNGPMPQHLTEFIIDWSNGHSARLARIASESGGRPGVAAGLSTDAARELERQRIGRFFDVFHHRLIALFYRVWAHHDQAVHFDRGDDPFSGYVGSLAGLAQEAVRPPGRVAHQAKLHQVGHLSRPSPSPEGLVAILEDYFDVPAEVIEFVGQWIDVPESCRTLLGVANHRLGSADLPSLWDQAEGTNASAAEPAQVGLGEPPDDTWPEISETLLGDRIFDRAQKFRLRIGPMPMERFRQFLPGGGSHDALVDWVRQYVGDELDWDLQLVLDQAEPLAAGGPGQLGLTTWLADEKQAAQGSGLTAQQDLDDLILEPTRVRTSRALGA